MSRTLIGGVGYMHLSDLSFGPAVSEALAAQSWPDGILVEDLSYGPVTVSQRLDDEQPPLARWIVIGAVARGRPPGTLTVYRWDRALPDTDAIQARVAEAVGGVIALDNLIIVAAGLGSAPAETIIVELEPQIDAFGDGFSPLVARALPLAVARVRAIALGDAVGLPQAPLEIVA